MIGILWILSGICFWLMSFEVRKAIKHMAFSPFKVMAIIAYSLVLLLMTRMLVFVIGAAIFLAITQPKSIIVFAVLSLGAALIYKRTCSIPFEEIIADVEKIKK